MPEIPAMPTISPDFTSRPLTWIGFSPVRSGAARSLTDQDRPRVGGHGRTFVERGDRLIADHHRRHCLAIEIGDLARAREAAFPQHGDLVGERRHLVELVGDHQDRELALLGHCAHKAQNLFGLGGSQNRSRLIEHQEVSAEIELLDDFEFLLFAGGEVAHGHVERQVERHRLHEGGQRLSFLAPVDDRRHVLRAR